MGNTLSKFWGDPKDEKSKDGGFLDADLPRAPGWLVQKDPLGVPEEDSWFEKLRDAIEATPLADFDPGVLSEELLDLDIYEKVTRNPDGGSSEYAGGNITEGTYAGTQAAMTQIYDRLEKAYGSYLDARGIEPTLPRYIELEEKKELYQFSSYPYQDGEEGTENDGEKKPAFYPPHLETIPKSQDIPTWQIFNALGLAETGLILLKVVPDTFLGRTAEWILEKVRAGIEGTPEDGLRIRDVERYNRFHRRSGTDIMRGDNVGLLGDWYGDRRFAEQSFSGTNPTTITRCPDGLFDEFVEAAGRDDTASGQGSWAERLPRTDRASLFVQDCSYFRKAAGVADPKAEMKHQEEGSDENWMCASVTLFELHDDGKLHPAAIVIDYKGSMADSITIFNRRLTPAGAVSSGKEQGGKGKAAADEVNEHDDWPWRYAKTCAQVSDWSRHELAVHLTEAHFVEEAVIVAVNRTVPMRHAVFRTLRPHWYKTLSLNAAARDALVPQVVRDIVGLSPDQTSAFIRHAYETFDWVGNYVPNQLERRGFPSTPEALSQPRYRNYPYARNMTRMWIVIRKYVHAMLAPQYGAAPHQQEKNPDDGDKNAKPSNAEADSRVAADPALQAWTREMRTSGHMASFPSLDTFDALVDAVTMCIHLAAPYHTAVNYLQNFYQSFVVSKPPALCRPLPSSLAELRGYAEGDLVASTPMNRQRQWLLASQVPWLLSFKVASERSLLNFALSQWNVYKKKRIPEGERGDATRTTRDASKILYDDLVALAREFYRHTREMDEGAVPYMVMDPGNTAVSILI